jgi:dihydroneopterin aldolase
MEIILKDIKLFGFHGVTELERISGTEFCINISISIESNENRAITQLSDTIDYSEVFLLLKDEFAKPELLLEVLANRIASAVVKKYIIAQTVELTIMKLNAPIAGLDGQVGIKLKKNQLTSFK